MSDRRRHPPATGWHAPVCGIVILAALLGRAAPVLAADAPATAPVADVSSAVRRDFAELADRDPAVREQALVSLMGMPRQELPAFERFIERSRPLRPSQAAVLRQIVTQIYLAGEPYETNGHFGFLGIRMLEANVNQTNANPGPDAQPLRTGVVVLDRLPGFSGARFLRNGDVVLGIVEHPELRVAGQVEFMEAIRQLGPGKSVHFEVLRDGQVIKVGITLDARPIEADAGTTFDDNRRTKAEEYWQRAFAPLLKETTG